MRFTICRKINSCVDYIRLFLLSSSSFASLIQKKSTVIKKMGRSRSRTPSRKSSRSTHHSKKSRHRTRHRSSSSDSPSNRYKSSSSSSKYHSKRRRHDSKSPSSSHRSRSGRSRYRRSSSSSHTSSSSSSRSRSRSNSISTHSIRSSSSERRKGKPSASYMDKIRSIRTPTPPKLNFDASMELLDKRHAADSLADINADEFKPKAFTSTSNVKAEKSEADIIKIKGETRPIVTDSMDDPLFHQKV